jgi:hypothetical protein
VILIEVFFRPVIITITPFQVTPKCIFDLKKNSMFNTQMQLPNKSLPGLSTEEILKLLLSRLLLYLQNLLA